LLALQAEESLAVRGGQGGGEHAGIGHYRRDDVGPQNGRRQRVSRLQNEATG